MRTLFEICWHPTEYKCSVEPIRVIREGILPGCSLVSITAIDSKGRKFQGSPDDFYASEAEAWEAVRNTLTTSIADHEKELARIANELEAMREYLKTIMEY